MTGQRSTHEETIQDENTGSQVPAPDQSSSRWTRWIRLDRRTFRSIEGSDYQVVEGR